MTQPLLPFVLQIMVHNWRAGALVASMKGGTDKILAVSWSPDDSYIVTAGVNHVFFWAKSAAGNSFRQNRGVLGSVTKMQAFLCIGFAGANTILGAADGSLVAFNGEYTATGVVPAHEGPITAMYTDGASNTLLTGGQDGNFKIWKTKGKVTEQACHALGSGVRSVCLEAGQPYLVGTEKSEIFQVCAGADWLFARTCA